MRHQSAFSRGFTLIELMISVAVVGILLTLAAPSFYDFLLVQRLKGVNAELVTALQLARSEAVSRGRDVQVQFGTPGGGAAMSCYTLYLDTSANPAGKCDCTQPPGQRCMQPTSTEIRTVQIPASRGVQLALPGGQGTGFAFVSTTGTIRIGNVAVAGRLRAYVVESRIDDARRLRTEVGLSGRPTVCAPGGGVTGVPSC